MVRVEVEKLGYREVPGGYVLTGGVVALSGLDKLGELELNASVRIAIPEFLGVRDSSFINGVGIIQYVARNMTRTKVDAVQAPRRKASGNSNGGGGLVDKIKSWFSEFV